MSASFGQWLKKSRDLRGLDLEQVADSTRLPVRVLSALESDDVDALPDVAYGVKYARAAAEAIGLDPEDTALRYEEWRATQPAPTLPPPPTRLSRLAAIPRRLSADPIVWTLVGLTVLACALVLFWR